ncbi:Ribosome biogenesis protein brx1 [Borealophlyctis nickersoniae]|nr:Ribosome biogenesis protein brx1 [Borealophlyctis nickersoniae]
MSALRGGQVDRAVETVVGAERRWVKAGLAESVAGKRTRVAVLAACLGKCRDDEAVAGQRGRVLRGLVALLKKRPARGDAVQVVVEVVALTEDEEEDGDGVDGDEEGEEEDAQAEHEANGARRSTPYKNKQRVLLLSSRGITYRYRHLLTDLQSLLPHSKKDAKLDSKNKLNVLNELAELNNCNNCIYFEVRKKTDLYLWMSKTPNGPSVKFYVANVHTMDELRMTGNCLKGSRPLLSFDKNFDGQPHFQLLKEMFTQIFGTPRTSRKIKPFFDHILSFSIADDKIWFRNFQIVEKESTTKSKGKDISLVEIGPRFVLSIMRIFDGSFGGSTLFENPQFVSPNTVRRLRRQETQDAYRNRTQAALDRDAKLRDSKLPEDPLADVFR